jgi:taurine dioxygenase
MQINPLTCAIGAELVDVQLADALRDDGLFAEIKAALLKHKVLFLRRQSISRAEHVGFARRFGELEDHPVVGSDPEHPGLVQIYKTPDKPLDRYENSWHCDATWREVPPMGCVLRCVECPPVGGDTMWANMALAYEMLPSHIKDVIAPLRARHSIECTFGAAMPAQSVWPSRRSFRMRSTRWCVHIRKPVKKCCLSAASPLISRTSTRPPMCVWARTSPRAHPVCCSS